MCVRARARVCVCVYVCVCVCYTRCATCCAMNDVITAASPLRSLLIGAHVHTGGDHDVPVFSSAGPNFNDVWYGTVLPCCPRTCC